MQASRIAAFLYTLSLSLVISTHPSPANCKTKQQNQNHPKHPNKPLQTNSGISYYVRGCWAPQPSGFTHSSLFSVPFHGPRWSVTLPSDVTTPRSSRPARTVESEPNKYQNRMFLQHNKYKLLLAASPSQGKFRAPACAVPSAQTNGGTEGQTGLRGVSGPLTHQHRSHGCVYPARCR